MSSNIPLKLFLKNSGCKSDCEVRRIDLNIHESQSFQGLHEKLLEIFPQIKDEIFSVTWEDNDHDLVTITSDHELNIALKEMKGPIYKINILVKSKEKDTQLQSYFNNKVISPLKENIKKLLRKRHTPSTVGEPEAQRDSIPIMISIVGISIFLVIFGDILCNMTMITLAIIYPAYCSIHAMTNQDEKSTRRWVKYWVLVSICRLLEVLFSVILTRMIPMFWLVRLGLVAWCVVAGPRNGAEVIYGRLVRPAFQKYKSDIESIESSAKVRMSQIVGKVNYAVGEDMVGRIQIGDGNRISNL